MHPNKLWYSSKQIRERYDVTDSRTLHLTGAAGTVRILLGLGKILSGALALSVFACMNGGYTLGMALARYCALHGAAKTVVSIILPHSGVIHFLFFRKLGNWCFLFNRPE